MAKVKTNGLQTRYYKLERLVALDSIEMINEMILNGVSKAKVSDYILETEGFSISRDKLYEYDKMLREAVAKKITIQKMLGITKSPKKAKIISQAMNSPTANQLVSNELEVLDAVIQKGFAILQTPVTDLKTNDVLKAIELKNKLTQGSHGGLTGYGIEQIRTLENNKMNVIIQTISEYLDDDQMAELEVRLEQVERDYYETYAPEMLAELEKDISEQMVDMNTRDSVDDLYDPQGTIVSDDI